jgi:AraC-like DNA-binding protein
MAQSSGPFHVHRPAPPLSELIDFFWIYEDYAAPHRRERLLPTGTSELVFTRDANGRAASGVVGARTTSVMLDTSTPFSVIAVHFRPGGAFPFFSVPGTELRDRNETLDAVWGSYAASVSDRLWDEGTAERRFDILEQAMLTKARGRFDRHAAVRHALDVFDRSNGAKPVADVVQRLGVSARSFNEVFRSEVGLSAKLYCRIRRFNEVLTRIERLTDVDWADIAFSCGYFDQAHFNHDFRAFAGVSPTSYLRDRMSRTHVVVRSE